eukprot:1918227-Rhodomonas_salina.2
MSEGSQRNAAGCRGKTTVYNLAVAKASALPLHWKPKADLCSTASVWRETVWVVSVAKEFRTMDSPGDDAGQAGPSSAAAVTGEDVYITGTGTSAGESGVVRALVRFVVVAVRFWFRLSVTPP